MSDWAVGDLAVCVDASNNFLSGVAAFGLAEGRTYTVSEIDFEPHDPIPVGLLLAGVPVPVGFTAFNPARFRKISPDKHEACETEFVTLLQRIKRKQVA